MMVWNVTNGKVVERMGVSPDRAWAVLDAYAQKYGLEDQDWRLEKPWYEPE